MNVITIGPLEYLYNRLDKNLYYTYKNLIENFNNHHHIDTTNLKNTKININDIVTKNFSNINKANILVYILTGPDIGNNNNELINYKEYKILYDIEDPKVWKQELFINKYNIQYISIRYKCSEMDKLKSIFNNRNFYNFPLYRNINVFNNKLISKEFKDGLNKDKDIDILFYGAIDENTYPLRTKIWKLVKLMKDDERFKKYNIKIINSCERIEGSQLNSFINRTKYGISTSRNLDCLLGKYIELILGDCLIIGNIPSQEKDLFNNRYINLDINMTYGIMANKIIDAIDNYDYYYNKFKSLTDEFKKKFSFEKSIIDFNEIYNDILLN